MVSIPKPSSVKYSIVAFTLAIIWLAGGGRGLRVRVRFGMGRYLPVPPPYTKTDVEKFIARQLLLNREVHPSWAIEHAGTVVGEINIRFDFDKWLGEIGYSIAQKHCRNLNIMPKYQHL